MYEHTLAPCLVTSQAAMNGCNLRLQIWRPVLPARTKSASKPPAVMTGIRNSTLFMDGLTSHVAPPASAAARACPTRAAPAREPSASASASARVDAHHLRAPNALQHHRRVPIIGNNPRNPTLLKLCEPDAIAHTGPKRNPCER